MDGKEAIEIRKNDLIRVITDKITSAMSDMEKTIDLIKNTENNFMLDVLANYWTNRFRYH